MQRVTLQIVFVVAASLCLHSAAFASGSKKGKARTYEITITNLTKWQVIPPPVLGEPPQTPPHLADSPGNPHDFTGEPT